MMRVVRGQRFGSGNRFFLQLFALFTALGLWPGVGRNILCPPTSAGRLCSLKHFFNLCIETVKRKLVVPQELTQILLKFAIFIALVPLGALILGFLVSGTFMVRAMLPKQVIDAVQKLLPRSHLADARASATGQFELKVSDNAKLQTVFVHQMHDMTFAWTFDPTVTCPQSGTFALTLFRHNIQPNSVLDPNSVQTRVSNALDEALKPKEFQLSSELPADICVRVFAAIEDEVTFENLDGVFDTPDSQEWVAALETFARHKPNGDQTVLAKGSLLLEITDGQSGLPLWHAVAIADIVVNVSEAERNRRIQSAISGMLQKFPQGFPP